MHNCGVESLLDVFPANRFSVIHSQGVMEHLRDPIATMHICRNLLIDDGLICFAVANELNPFQQILLSEGKDAWWFIPPEHINYFNISSLKKLFRKNGFEVVSTISTFPMEIFLLMGDNYLADKSTGRNCHLKRCAFEKAISNSEDDLFLEKIYSSFAELGIDRTVEIIGRKINA